MAPVVKAVRLRAATSVVGLGTFLSRLAGLGREVAMAAVFGAGLSADIFFVAYRIPNTLRRLLAEGGVTVAVQPVYAGLLADDQARRRYERAVFGLTRLVLALVALLLFVAAPWIVPLFAAGFTPGGAAHAEAVLLLRLLVPYVWFVGLMGLGMGLLAVLGRFFTAAVGQGVLNLVFIAGALSVWWWVPAGWPATTMLAVASVIGMGLWWAMIARDLRKAGVETRGTLDVRAPGVDEAARLLLPAVAGLAVYQLQVAVGTQFASFLPAGGVSALSYADRLVQFPLSMLGTAVGTVALPLFSRARSEGLSLAEPLGDAIGWVMFLVLPATVGLWLVADPLVTVVFQHGAFDAAASARTAAALAGYAAALVPAALSRVLMPALYADRDMKTPVFAGLAALLVQATLSYLLFEHDVFGLALATAAGSAVQVLWLSGILLARGQRPRGMSASVIRTSVATLGMAAAVLGLRGLVAGTSPWLQLPLLAGGGAAGYGLACAALGHPEMRRLREVAARRRRRGRN
jgi:putative peptidoglycan lipid II flippase